jgi:hypothetical protein
MAIAGRTREQLRVSIGYNLGAIREVEADASGSTSTLLTDELALGGADEHIGKWLVFTSGNNDGEIRRITDSAVSSNRNTLTFHPTVGTSTADGHTAELWDEKYNPEVIHDLINQSIMFSYSQVYNPVEDISLHGDRNTARFDIPSGISMLNKIKYRSKVTSKKIHAANATFDEKTDAEFTQSLDTEDKKQGSQSLKMVIGSGAAAGDFVTDSISSTDLSKYDTIEMWVKSTVATSAGNLKLLLDNSASCASPLETLSIPALTADTWTFVRISLSNPETDTAIISVGLEYDSDLGACTVWVDDIRAVVHDSGIWEQLPQRLWRIDKPNRDLYLTEEGRNRVNYSLIKLIGGDEPALLTSDSDTNEIDDQYVISQSTGLAIQSMSMTLPPEEQGAMRRQSTLWFGIAEQSRGRFPALVNVRSLE